MWRKNTIRPKQFSLCNITALILFLLLVGTNIANTLNYPVQESPQNQNSELKCYKFSLALVTEAYYMVELTVDKLPEAQEISNFDLCLSPDNSATVQTTSEGGQKTLACSSGSLKDTIGRLSKTGRFFLSFKKDAFPSSDNLTLNLCVANLNQTPEEVSYRISIRGKNIDTLCPFDCFEKGSCIQNKCQCNELYLGRDCGTETQKVRGETKIELEVSPKVYSYIKIDISESKKMPKISNFVS